MLRDHLRVPRLADRRPVSVIRRRAVLYAVCAVGSAAEAAAMYAMGYYSAMPLAPQVVAAPPFGAYHDLRWVFTFSSSWFSLAWQLAALLVFRTVIVTALSLLSWPDDVVQPRMRALVGRSVSATLLTIVVMSPWATLAFASAAVSYSWFMLASAIAAAATAIVLPSFLISGEWWQHVIPWRGMLFSVATWLALMVEAMAIYFSPGWVKILAAAGGGALNALLWQHQVITLVHAAPARRRFPLAPVALIGVLALFLVVGGYWLGATKGSAHGSTNAEAPKHVAAPGTPLSPIVDVQGYGSSYNGQPPSLFGQRIWRFSYAGMSGGEPKAYEAVATHQSLAASADRLAAQVNAVHAVTRAPVVLLGESEGTLVVRRYLQRHPDAPVRMFIEFSPLLRPASVYFPPKGRNGYGIIGGWETRGLLALVRAESPATSDHADEPFIRSVVDDAGRLRGRTVCPAAGTRIPVYAYVPLEGALTVYSKPISHVPWTAIPGYHGSVLNSDIGQKDVATLLRTDHFATHGKATAAFRVLSGAAAAWQVPALPLSMRPGWRAAAHTDPAFTGWSCAGAGS